MLYFSELTEKKYATLKELEKDEKKFQAEQEAKKLEMQKKKEEEEKLLNERKTRAKEVEDAYQVAVNATKKYQELLNAFIKDYRSYHFSISSTSNFDNLIDSFMTLF